MQRVEEAIRTHFWQGVCFPYYCPIAHVSPTVFRGGHPKAPFDQSPSLNGFSICPRSDLEDSGVRGRPGPRGPCAPKLHGSEVLAAPQVHTPQHGDGAAPDLAWFIASSSQTKPTVGTSSFKQKKATTIDFLAQSKQKCDCKVYASVCLEGPSKKVEQCALAKLANRVLGCLLVPVWCPSEHRPNSEPEL